MIRRRIGWIVWAGTGTYWIAIFIATHLPPRNLPRIRVSDKAIHFWSYVLLAAAIYTCIWLMNRSLLRTAVTALLIVCCYAAIDEVLQIPVGRTCDFRDWLADAGGALLAVMVMSSIRLMLQRSGKPLVSNSGATRHAPD